MPAFQGGIPLVASEAKIPVIIAEFIFLIGFFDKSGLYCNSRSFLDSTINVTPFCVISGTYKLDIII